MPQTTRAAKELHSHPTCLLKSLGGRPRRFGGLAAEGPAVSSPAGCAATVASAGDAASNRSGSVLVLALPPMLPERLALRSRWLLAALLRPLAARHLHVQICDQSGRQQRVGPTRCAAVPWQVVAAMTVLLSQQSV